MLVEVPLACTDPVAQKRICDLEEQSRFLEHAVTVLTREQFRLERQTLILQRFIDELLPDRDTPEHSV